jgi:hypothetical protein
MNANLRKREWRNFQVYCWAEKELKQELADLPKYDPALVANSVESMANTLHLILTK